MNMHSVHELTTLPGGDDGAMMGQTLAAEALDIVHPASAALDELSRAAIQLSADAADLSGMLRRLAQQMEELWLR